MSHHFIESRSEEKTAAPILPSRLTFLMHELNIVLDIVSKVASRRENGQACFIP